MGAESFLRGLLKGFYNSAEIDTVPEIASREFGIGEFGQKISSRHLSFRSAKELNAFLRERPPFYISYSCARYELPSARPMEKKGMLGSDLIFEFDADDIKTECKKRHDSWKCPSCGAAGKGHIRKCSHCGSGTKVDEWVCMDCIGETRRQTQKLLAFLQGDFGFSEGISINFSGSKGFHMHVRSKDVQALSKAARLELLDYITSANLDMDALGFKFDKGKKSYVCPLKNERKGWAKKICDNLASLFDSNDEQTIAVIGGISLNSAKILIKGKDKILSHMDNGLLAFPETIRKDADKFWKHCINHVVGESKVEFGSNILHDELLNVDRQTSVDINKIIRVPNTIHGSTGLQARVLGISELGSFDALNESVVMPEAEVGLRGAIAPEFSLKGRKFGPYNGEDVSLPAYAAFYLLARGAASEAM